MPPATLRALSRGRFVVRPWTGKPIRITAEPSGAVLFPDGGSPTDFAAPPEQTFALSVPEGQTATLVEAD